VITATATALQAVLLSGVEVTDVGAVAVVVVEFLEVDAEVEAVDVEVVGAGTGAVVVMTALVTCP